MSTPSLCPTSSFLKNAFNFFFSPCASFVLLEDRSARLNRLWIYSPFYKMNTNVKSVGVKDVDQSDFVVALSAFLKKSGKLRVPEWSDLVKTAVYKELAPYDEDWFYTRCASVARHLYHRQPVGVGALTKIYGGRYRRGVRPSHFARGGTNVARKALQSLEAINWVEKDANSGGRRLTSQGYKDLDRIASQVKEEATKQKLVQQEAAVEPEPAL